MDSDHFMRRAIELSREGMISGGGPFGAVVVKGDTVIGEGRNSVVPALDPTAHAEIVAIRNACRRINSFDLKGAIIFSSCEPCPMCLGAIWWARIEKIYYGNTRVEASAIGFDDNEMYDEVALPVSERRIPLIQSLHDESIKVFKEWALTPNKTMY